MKDNRFLNVIKKIPGFLADVFKYSFDFLRRKLKERYLRFLNGRTLRKALSEAAAALFGRFKRLPAYGKALAVLGLVLLVCVCSLHSYCASHFLAGTYIKGVDVSGMSLSEAREAITRESESYELVLLEKDGQAETIKGSDIALTVTISKKFNNVLKLRSGYFWLSAVMKNETADPGDTIVYTYDEAMLTRKISELDCMNVSSVKEPVDAELYFADGQFKVREAISGNTVDEAKLESRIKAAVEAQESSLDLQAEGLYEQPAVLTDDPALLAKKTALEDLSSLNISLKFGSAMETVGAETAASWYSADASGSLKLEEDKVRAYVSQLAAKYDTISSPKLFVTSAGETIQIDNSYYGWQLDADYAVSMLTSFVSERKSVTLDLTDRSEESDKWWTATGVAYDELGYYGDTYAEVSIDRQYMWMYSGGQVVFESDVVTGSPDSEHDTPVGIYSIIYKEQNATLRGENYETEVAYWMVFTYDIGFHDAEWQDAFGDDMYEYSGSHGCVNLPVDAAGELYELVYPGMPVFVY